MLTFSTRSLSRRLAALCLTACLPCLGCAGWGPADAGPLASTSPNGELSPDAEVSSEAAEPEPPAPLDSFADRAVLARASDNQGRSVWVPAGRPSPDHASQPQRRWRCAALEELVARPADQRPDFRRYLADRDPILATHAAIALSRLGDDAGARQLASAAGNRDLDLPLRYAAVEALAALPGPTAARLLGDVLDRYERQALDTSSGYNARLHAELIRALAQHVDPADDPRLADALGNPAREVRLEAIRAWARSRSGNLPVPIARLLEDADPRIRAAALAAMARQRHVEAHAYLADALHDLDFEIRAAAIAALGELGDEKARATLERLMDDRVDRIRAAAVSALARCGAEQAVLDAADDESWRVRLEVARALAAYPDREGIAVANRLLDDPSAEVQQAVVGAVADWPLPQAGPVLLATMTSRSLASRQAAAEQLAARWPPAAEFFCTAPADRRANVLDSLQRRFRQQFGSIDRAALARAGSGGPTDPAVAPEQLARVELLLRQRDVAALTDYGPGLVEALEQLVFDRQQLLPEFVYEEVLLRYDPAFIALRRLGSADPRQRREAADQLAELAAQRPLGRLVLERLGRVVAAESDQLVWRSVLTATSGDAREPAARLACAAIGHPSPEVRRRACENLAACADSRYAGVLVPALEDPNHSVRCAAVRALGAAGRLDDTEPLRRLLQETNEQLRLETALALVRLGDSAGRIELERLAYSGDPTVGRQVALAMGETGDATFVPTLIRMLDGRAAVARAALESLPKVVGDDAVGDDGPTSTSQQIDRWKAWYASRWSLSGRRYGGPVLK